MIVEVALNLPLRKTFDYQWPDNLLCNPEIGLLTLVPFGSSKKGGIIVRVKEHSKFAKLKKIEKLVNEEPVFSKEILELTKWASSYYFCAWGETLNAAIPGGLNLRIQTTYEKQFGQLENIEKLSQKLYNLIISEISWNHQDWLKCNPNNKDRRILSNWITNKVVLTKHTLLGEKNKHKMERWVNLINEAATVKKITRKKTKRQQILELLRKNPKISWSDIQSRVKSPSYALKKLKDDGIVDFFEKRIYRRFLEGELPKIEPFQILNKEQKTAYNKIYKSLKKGNFQTFLLEGVTGSGKTEVYLHTVLAAKKLGKSSLILVPEISLTPQVVNRFRSRFGDLIAVLHSGMDDGERFDEWSRVKNGIATIVIGTRSAVFSPQKNLGLIIIDEEHDTSYKQGEVPRYNGRDTAIYRGLKANATVLLGSATPSLESSKNVNIEKYTLLQLTSRINQKLLPEVKLLDMNTEPCQKGSPYFSSELIESLRHCLNKKEQSIVFLNRRGFAPLVRCEICESTYTCPNCSLSLVYHQGENQVRCHQCDYGKILQIICPYCGSNNDPKIIGTGTEQVEENLKLFFPEARILRMDRDSLHGKHALSKMHDLIQKHEVDIVIGTQLVTKGHDFPEVTLVGVILSDLSLNIPDFRASERTFQLLTQVAGRAGRGKKPGKVIIQTYNPNHHSLYCAKKHDTRKFKEIELKQREYLKMPPFHSLTIILCSSPIEERAEKLARDIAIKIQNFILEEKKIPGGNSKSLTNIDSFFRVIGPIEAPMKKLRNRFRWQLILKAREIKSLSYLLNQIFPLAGTKKRDDLIQIDIDPHNML